MDLKEVKKAILDGKVYASIVHVSSTGMMREIKFYTIKNDSLVNITDTISEMTGRKTGKRRGVKVTGCGMDMIFHTLYCALGYELAKDWNQKYSTI